MALQTGLISYYKLDETSGTIAYDSLGINNGTNKGVTINVAGKIGTAYYSSQSSFNYITSSFSYPNKNSIQLWFKTNSSSTSRVFIYGSSYQAISFNFPRKIDYYGDTTGSLSPSSFSVNSSFDMNNNQWNHLVITHDGDNTNAIIYLNGVLLGSMNLRYRTGANLINIFRYAGISSERFNGMIDEVGIWNRALSSTEVSELYNGGRGLTYPFPAIEENFIDSVSLSEKLSKSITKHVKESVVLDDTVSLPGQIISKIIYYNKTNIAQARAEIVFENKLNYKIYLSNNDGLTWEEAQEGSTHTFTSVGQKLRYKLTADPGTIINKIIITKL